MSYDGGPAFPLSAELRGNRNASSIEGMSLRDYFAAQALRCVTAGDHVDGQGDANRHAALAYEYADAMLRAREAK